MREMLDHHHFVYYKPSAGSLGHGIYRLTYLPKKGYFARYRRGGKNVLLRFTTFEALMRMLRSRHGQNLQNYIVQQGIRLIEIDGCPIDFRFHMHKNGSNQWIVVGIGAKKPAVAVSPLTLKMEEHCLHLSKHSDVYSAQELTKYCSVQRLQPSSWQNH